MRLDQYDTDLGLPERGSGLAYIHCTPLDAVQLSRTNRALGYDLLRWGEKYSSDRFGDDNDEHVAIALPTGVFFLVGSELEEQFIRSSADSQPERGVGARKQYVQAKNFFLWESLTRFNEDFIQSLFWIPEIPVSSLEALAMTLD